LVRTVKQKSAVVGIECDGDTEDYCITVLQLLSLSDIMAA